MHYLDHAATTPVPAPVAQAMLEVLTQQYGNPSAQYPLGQEAKAVADSIAKTYGITPMIADCQTLDNEQLNKLLKCPSVAFPRSLDEL